MATRAMIFRFALAALPLAATPLVFYSLAEGWIDLGGGEKDVLLSLPYLVWSFVFFVASFVQILKGRALIVWLGCSTILATLALLALGGTLYALSLLGIT